MLQLALMMDDSMEVDPPTSSAHKRAPTSPASPSANKRLKSILPTAQLCALNDTMDRISRRNLWQHRIVDAQKDDSQSEWQGLFSDILICLLLQLSNTNLKDSVIPPLACDSLVNDLTDDEFKEWVNGVQTGVKEKDWAHLIAHRTYILHLKTWPSLIATTAKLQARIPAPAPSLPDTSGGRE